MAIRKIKWRKRWIYIKAICFLASFFLTGAVAGAVTVWFVLSRL